MWRSSLNWCNVPFILGAWKTVPREGLCVDTQLNLKQTTFSEAVVIIFKNIIEHLMTS